jgi:hypothetical protein
VLLHEILIFAQIANSANFIGVWVFASLAEMSDAYSLPTELTDFHLIRHYFTANHTSFL